jgi:hemerythrin-like domain-containing protein
MSSDPHRRVFLAAAAATGAAMLARTAGAKPSDDEDVSPTEDLMQEHGVLRRVLIIYDEAIRRINGNLPVPVDAVADAAQIVRDFIEDYHEKDEEDVVFPILEKQGGANAALVGVLRAQHQVGRKLTDEILFRATAAAMAKPGTAATLGTDLARFSRMYAAHAAREDTVLFPAFRAAVGKKALAKLQRVFEEREKALPHGGFEKTIDAVAAIEARLGIGDLAKFTP